MTNQEKYEQTFIDCLGVLADELPTLVYQGVSTWDSVGHMQLIAELEEAFDIMMDTDDIIDFSGFEKGKEILGKYDVEF